MMKNKKGAVAQMMGTRGIGGTSPYRMRIVPNKKRAESKKACRGKDKEAMG